MITRRIITEEFDKDGKLIKRMTEETLGKQEEDKLQSIGKQLQDLLDKERKCVPYVPYVPYQQPYFDHMVRPWLVTYRANNTAGNPQEFMPKYNC